MSRPDVSAHIGKIARIILGEPNRRLSTRQQLRYGSNGSTSIEIAGPKRGDWFDHEEQVGGGPYEFISIKGQIPADKVDDWLNDHSFPCANGHDRSGKAFNIVKTYDYCDEKGALLFQVCRLAPKDFRQRAPDGTWQVKDIRKVPYRLPELIAASIEQTVFICEGEKDADRLAAAGLVATTNPGGAAKRRDDGKPRKSKWLFEFNSFFAGRSVVILPDNDDAVRDHAKSIVANLARIARSVTILELPGLPPKGDVSDWLNAGGTIDELTDLAKSAAPKPPEDDLKDYTSVPAWLAREIPDPVFLLGEVLSTTNRGLLVADTGVDKTNYIIAMAAADGRDFLHWRGSGKPMRVLLVEGEMSRRLVKGVSKTWSAALAACRQRYT